jgi:probable DNA repair protein
MTHFGSDVSTQLSGISTQILDHEMLFSRLQAGHTLITGNSRLSRVLSNQYGQWHIDKGDKQWPSPEIYSWGLWLDKLWETASLQGVKGAGRAVPGNRQLINLWESTLKNEAITHNLLHPESLASQLQETRNLLTSWQLSLKDPAWFGNENENYGAFYHWNKAFEKRCDRDNWISPEDRTGVLCTALREEQLRSPVNIDLLGFDEFNPDQSDLLSALTECGVTVSELMITSRQNKAVLFKSKDSKTELQQMARWVRHWFEEDPATSIAVVVPDLQARRQEVERHLAEILTPGIDEAGRQATPWNISMGTPLARVPMIEAAFNLLKLLEQRIDIQDIGRVLRSPWLRGAREERNSRALLEKCLREKYPRQLKLEQVAYRAGEIKTRDHHRQELPVEQHTPQPWNSPQLSSVLAALTRFEKNSKDFRPASAWAGMFDQLLSGLGWPLADEAGTAISEEEHAQNWQALQAWRSSLRELASLDTTTHGLERQAAIRQLKQICQERIFQAHTRDAPVQILGLYEVSGLRFDHLWVVGLHNDNWPPAARPNPFIPGKLQKAARIPNSSPQRELEVARVITRRLLETAPDCVFSYPGQLDGEDVLPSPLLANKEINPVEDLPAWRKYNWRAVVANAEQPHIEPLITPGKLKTGTARGGSSILKHQALCPFRAFASNRLGADGLETPADGISPMLHGSLVHSVLENFWKETKTQAALLLLDEENLSSRVRKHVNNAVNEERGLQQRPAFRSVEAERLYRHVLAFLELDGKRDPFEVIGFEREILPEIEGQTIRLIIDRIDQLPSGEEIIIDYKTGKVAAGKWFGDRPEDPQLPLYAISAGKTPAAVAFAIIREDGCLYKGVVKQEGLLPGLPPGARKDNQYLIDAGYQMPATIDNWRQVLHGLMSAFLAGEAQVDPKDGRKTCDTAYCKLQSLCRIGELEQRQKITRGTTA